MLINYKTFTFTLYASSSIYHNSPNIICSSVPHCPHIHSSNFHHHHHIKKYSLLLYMHHQFTIILLTLFLHCPHINSLNTSLGNTVINLSPFINKFISDSFSVHCPISHHHHHQLSPFIHPYTLPPILPSIHQCPHFSPVPP
jgi:hypothetical protein